MPAGPPELYDLLIVGAGPAGCAAAIRAGRDGLRSLLVDSAAFPRKRACNGWIGPAGVALIGECGMNAAAAGATPFTGMTLRSWDLKKKVDVREKDLTGWFVDRAVFDAALLELAVNAGAKAVHGVTPATLALGEKQATLRLSDQREVRGRVMLIADGVESATARLAKLLVAGRGRDLPRCVHATLDGGGSEVGLEVVLGAGRTAQVLTLVRAGGQVRMSFLTRETAPPPVAQLQQFVAIAQEAGVLPKRGALHVAAVPSAAGAALDFESHVGKGALLIGDAGGFVAEFSNEGIYPAMRSGWIAAETVARALGAAVLQDELASFSAAWRAALADYLRLPNTDLTLLLPLVFNNPQMSRRVARAFLLGQKF